MYTDIHRSLLQYLMTAGFAPVHQILEQYRKLKEVDTLEDTNLKDSLNTIINEINEAIKPYHQEIRLGVCEITGRDFLIFMNTANNEISRMQSEFHEKDLEFFKLIVDEIVYSPEKQISEQQCLSLANRVSGTYPSTKAKELIENLIWKGYFSDLSDDYISLGIRCIYECEQYIRDKYKDQISDCPLCKEVVFIGHSCTACQMIFHTHCFNKYVEKRNKCPNCQENVNQCLKPSLIKRKV